MTFLQTIRLDLIARPPQSTLNPFQYQPLPLSPLFHSPPIKKGVILLDDNALYMLTSVVTTTSHLHQTLPYNVLPCPEPRRAALLQHQSKAHPQSFQSLPHSFAEKGGWHQERSRFSHFPLSPLRSALTQITPLSSLESALTKTPFRNSFRIRTYEKNRGMVDQQPLPVISSPPPFRRLA